MSVELRRSPDSEKSPYSNPILVTWYFRALRERAHLTQRAMSAAARERGLSIPLSLSGNLESRGISEAMSTFLHYTLLIGMAESTLAWTQRRAVGSPSTVAKEIAAKVLKHREQQGLSQQELSDRSKETPSRISKGYVAHQEVEGPSQPVLVSFQYASLAGADANLIRELATLEPRIPKQTTFSDFNDLGTKIIEASRQRRDDWALGLCLGWLQRAPRSDPTAAKALLCTSIVMSNRNSWRAAEFLARLTLREEGCVSDTRQRTLIQLVRVHTAMGDPDEVDRLVSELRALPDPTPDIEALRFYHLGVASLRRHDGEAARANLAKALALFSKSRRSGQRSATLVTLAEVHIMLGNKEVARSRLIEAETVMVSVEDSLRGHLLMNAGDVAIMAGETLHAAALFRKGLVVAEREENRPLVFRANLSLCELALMRRDCSVARRHAGALKRNLHHVSHDREVLQRFRQLIDLLNANRRATR